MITHSRNWAFIPVFLQERLSTTRVGIAGCGLGSVVAESLLRVGVKRFVIADGDKVELSNLNRQLFTFKEAAEGVNKAAATAKRLKMLDPGVDVRCIKQFVRGREQIEFFLKDVDYLLNTVDLDENYLEFNQVARVAGIPVLFPLNVGFGSALMIFLPESPTLEDMFSSLSESKEGLKDSFIHRILAEHPRPYLADILRIFLQRTPDTWPCDPQLGIAAHCSASLITTSIIQMVSGVKIKSAPQIIALDALMAVVDK